MKKSEIDFKTLKQFEKQVELYRKNLSKGTENKSEAFEKIIKNISVFYKKRGKGLAKTRTKTNLQKEKLNILLRKFKGSKFSTAKARKKRGYKTKKTLNEKYGYGTASRSIGIFSSNAYHYLKNLALFDSDQVISIAQDYDSLTVKEIAQVFEEMQYQLERDLPEELKEEIKTDDLYQEIDRRLYEKVREKYGK